MKKLHTRDDGSASHWTMTRREFYATHRDYRNSPGRTDAPMRLALDPLTGGTVSVQVMFSCKHGTPEKIRCPQCEGGGD